MSIQIFTTGGTFDKLYHDALSEFSIGEPMAGPLLADAGVNFDYQITSLLKKDSLEFTDSDRELLARHVRQAAGDKILVIHGTDTMTHSAAALGGVPGKTVVFTGAMLPARMLHSDAPFNLGFALGALQCLPAGVYIAMNGQIFNAGQVQKNRAQSRFESL
ncbi:asparaginase domain-containing protein [Thiopseudomonas denitrificans]|uniref:L-asparaginase n=1 Tax=Thiopseudomonas denitrificans TaxID=1501432 RepID=A0A4R6U0K9_9GAMM|nr:asparaginase domain-containing protein [Thiopseudomonas denitrificans]TDQ39471.1 L-asparaginase [Thiopseudomonas denitrificans]